MPECPECGAGADLTPDGTYAHCASCNNIFQPGKDGSSEKGSGSGSGDKAEAEAEAKGERTGNADVNDRENGDGNGNGNARTTRRKEWTSGIKAGTWGGDGGRTDP